jgi:hypothetical protein
LSRQFLRFFAALCSWFKTAPTQTSASKSTVTKPKVELAVWDDTAEKSFGITEEAFKSMGLRKLTSEEYKAVLTWEAVREMNAESKGIDKGKAAAQATLTTYSCGPDQGDAQSLSKVNLLIGGSADTPSEIMSLLRERLRRIPDIQIVFGKKEADLVISVMGFTVKMQTTSDAVGYTAATTATVPCTWTIGAYSGTFDMMQDEFLNTSNLEVAGLVESIVTTLDSQDFETVRQQKANLKKSGQSSKQ